MGAPDLATAAWLDVACIEEVVEADMIAAAADPALGWNSLAAHPGIGSSLAAAEAAAAIASVVVAVVV